MDEKPEPLMLKVRDVAALLSMSEQTVRKLIKAGTLPSVQLGQGARFTRVPMAAVKALADCSQR